MMKVDLDMQITTAELQLLSQRAHVDNLYRLVRKREREPHHVEEAEQKIPKLEAILATLKWLKANEEAIRRALSEKK